MQVGLLGERGRERGGRYDIYIFPLPPARFIQLMCSRQVSGFWRGEISGVVAFFKAPFPWLWVTLGVEYFCYFAILNQAGK